MAKDKRKEIDSLGYSKENEVAAKSLMEFLGQRLTSLIETYKDMIARRKIIILFTQKSAGLKLASNA